jgi:phosphoglycerol transferase MdoB-like AlkP superfamily enzyme
LIPRRPAFVDRYGKPRMTSNDDFHDDNYDRLYAEQVLYANTLIDSFAQAANSRQHTRPFVLIIEGDHGNRYGQRFKDVREKSFMNLSTYYFSDRNYAALYDSISSVNSFRVVLNKYFNTALPLLKDSTVMIN